ncbi:MAG: xanthine dehydrogenase family protein subunit M [Thermoleophilia bacterium]|nr:xanthine dehydrogenase family protein subunit M [Thermoleophilia bacterium]
MRAFDYARPSTLVEAFELLSAPDGGVKALAGGTDLLVGLRNGAIRPRAVVDLKHIRELAPVIRADKECMSIGANAVLAQLTASEGLRRDYPALVESAAVVGSVQIRHRATLAGNLCNASPAADTVPALLAYGADVVIRGPSGERRVSVDNFVLGPRETVLTAGEIVTTIVLPTPKPGTGAAFARLTRRRGVDLAILSVCCLVDPEGEVRFGLGAVGPRPFLVRDSAAAVVSSTAAEQFAALVAKASPITDVRASHDYRQAMITVLARRTLAAAIERSSWVSP